METKRLEIRVTHEQDRILAKKAYDAGFCRKNDYIRSVIFIEPSFYEKIDTIYNKLIKNA
jgi:hypothetical protein